MNRSHLLLELQNLDTRIEENRQARTKLQKHLSDDSALAAAKTAFEAAAQEEEGLRARLRSLELEVKGVEEQIRGVDRQLYGGKVTNAKELSGLERDEAMLKRNKGEIEDRMLVVMEQLETAHEQAAARRAAVDRATSARGSETVRDMEQLRQLEAAGAGLESERSALRPQISPADLQMYDGLYQAKKGRAVALIKGASCAACGVSVPSGVASRARVGDELTYCVNCGRILVPA